MADSKAWNDINTKVGKLRDALNQVEVGRSEVDAVSREKGGELCYDLKLT